MVSRKKAKGQARRAAREAEAAEEVTQQEQQSPEAQMQLSADEPQQQLPSIHEDSDAFLNAIKEMTVEGAGLREINGTYRRCGQHDGVSKYVRPSRYNGRSVDFMLFRCKLTDGTRRWYISIVPENTHPGTTQDIDFYAARLSSGAAVDQYPSKGWLDCNS